MAVLEPVTFENKQYVMGRNGYKNHGKKIEPLSFVGAFVVF